MIDVLTMPLVIEAGVGVLTFVVITPVCVT